MNEQKGSLYTITHEVYGITDVGVIGTFDITDTGRFKFSGFSFLKRRTVDYTLEAGSHYVLRIFYPSFDTSRSKRR